MYCVLYVYFVIFVDFVHFLFSCVLSPRFDCCCNCRCLLSPSILELNLMHSIRFCVAFYSFPFDSFGIRIVSSIATVSEYELRPFSLSLALALSSSLAQPVHCVVSGFFQGIFQIISIVNHHAWNSNIHVHIKNGSIFHNTDFSSCCVAVAVVVVVRCCYCDCLARHLYVC